MPTEVPAPTVISAADLATAVGITATTGVDYRLTDAYGVTYTGTPAHLALSALARPDLIGRFYRNDRSACAGVHAAARLLIDWFTSPYVDPEHAAALAPMRVCELVSYLAPTASATRWATSARSH